MATAHCRRQADRSYARTGLRTRQSAHEYGGGEYHVSEGTVVYSEYSDGRLTVSGAAGAVGRSRLRVPSDSATFGSILSADSFWGTRGPFRRWLSGQHHRGS